MNVVRKFLSIYNFLYNYLVLTFNNVEYGNNLVINGRLYIRNKGKIIIGSNVTINSGLRYSPTGGFSSTRLITFSGGQIIISDKVGITNSTIVSQERIMIGEKTLIGGSCNIWDTNFHSLDHNLRNSPSDFGKTSPVDIGKSVFIGAHSIILKGSFIQNCSIVGAGTVGTIKLKDNQMYKP